MVFVGVGTAGAVLINYEDLVGGTFLTNQYVSEGIIFDGTWIRDGSSRGSPPNWISGENAPNNNLDPDPISGYFVNPSNLSQDATTDYIEGLSVYADTNTTVTLDVFGLDGLLLASVSRIDDGISSISQANIHGFVLHHNNPGIDDIIGFDNIVFNAVTLAEPAPVPEPSTLLLLGSGLGGLVFVRRRFKS